MIETTASAGLNVLTDCWIGTDLCDADSVFEYNTNHDWKEGGHHHLACPRLCHVSDSV